VGSPDREDRSSRVVVEDILGSQDQVQSLQVEVGQSRDHAEAEEGNSHGIVDVEDSQEEEREVRHGSGRSLVVGRVLRSSVERAISFRHSRHSRVEWQYYNIFNQKEGNGNIDMSLRIQYRSVIYIRNVSSLKCAGKESLEDVPEWQGRWAHSEEERASILCRLRRS
jgi:hypothetical protein